MRAVEFMLLAAIVIGVVLAFILASFENALEGFAAAVLVSLALWMIYAATGERRES